MDNLESIQHVDSSVKNRLLMMEINSNARNISYDDMEQKSACSLELDSSALFIW